jgi:hypothetical protein
MLDTIAILRQLPFTWTSNDAEQIKALFSRSRPAVPANVARSLWRYWQFHGRDKALFDDDKENIALMLHARAYGEHVPKAGEKNYAGDLLNKNGKLFKPLLSKNLTWGPRAALSSDVLAGLNSPIMHAWIIIDDETVKQVIVVGEGLPEIRYRVLFEVFMASLQVHAVAQDMMNIGALRVELPGEPVTPLNFDFDIIGDRKQPLSPQAAASAEAVLGKLLEFLQTMEQDTGLVHVHRAKAQDQTAISKAFQGFAGEARKNPRQVFLMANKQENTADPDLVTFVPYLPTRGPAIALNMAIHADLLQTPTYERLWHTYQFATITRFLMDIKARHDYYERQAEQHHEQKEHYEESTPAERQAIWGSSVELNERFNFALGITTKLLVPQTMPVDMYFRNVIPDLIEQYRDWQKRMKGILLSVKIAVERPDAPIRRFAASRFFDAAIRSRIPDESRAARDAFEAWREQIEEMLWFEWRSQLEREGIAVEDVFTPHTFLHTYLSPKRDGTGIGRLVISPFTLFDQKRSVTFFDFQRKVSIVSDATDFAEPLSTGTESIDEKWKKLEASVQDPRTDQQMFTTELHKMLRDSPIEALTRIFQKLFESQKSEQPGQSAAAHSGPSQREQMEKALQDARDKTELSREIGHAFSAINIQAFQTARESLRKAEGHPAWAARVYLMKAVVECLIDERPLETLLDIHHPSLSRFSSPLQVAMTLAMDTDEEYVTGWLRQLKTDLEEAQMGKSSLKAIGQLLHGLHQTRQGTTSTESAALLARGAIESAVLARELDENVSTLAEEHEATEIAFAKIGRTLEKMLLAEYAGGSQDELVELIAILTGKQAFQVANVGGAIE